jgi:hypothetical protein
MMVAAAMSIASVTGPATTGCSIFQTACAKATPSIVTAGVYTDDLAQWINEVRQQISVLPLSADKIADIKANLDKLSAIVNAARDAEASAISSCTTMDFASVLSGAVTIVKDVMVVVAMFGASPTVSHPALRQPMISIRLGANQ